MNNGNLSLIGKAAVLKTASNHLRRDVSVRVGGFPLIYCNFVVFFYFYFNKIIRISVICILITEILSIIYRLILHLI